MHRFNILFLFLFSFDIIIRSHVYSDAVGHRIQVLLPSFFSVLHHKRSMYVDRASCIRFLSGRNGPY